MQMSPISLVMDHFETLQCETLHAFRPAQGEVILIMTGAHVKPHTLEQCLMHLTISECSQNSDHTLIMYSWKCMHGSNRGTSKSHVQLDTESTALFYFDSCCTKLQALPPSPLCPQIT